ncbi:IPTL-CTERM sorting domain-containing protein [Marinobacterium iners]|uniref:IPTL-CTERM protein sorting domain-containing protein n=1 Tax=Marinobacterium iners DSM 11526 TaxID=1122198 RepID=A0A1H4C2L3_9GAMM|nr:IPTL-CTERM sorting domain-containing protein [Marinobacterium iners]SEA54619.1 IPTL-CTERM protein sorting domain-containing protein [Marinobacterium iners DSM 11526]
MPAPEHRTLTTKSQLFSDRALSLARCLTLLSTCTAPLLAQAQNCPTGDNIDDQYILGEANGVASAMHWPTGLVWKRCSEGQTFESGECTGTPQAQDWSTWAETNRLLPTSFANQTDWKIGASFSQNLLVSGGWRMAYKNELMKIAEGCGNNPKVNRTVFPNTPSEYFWSGSPYADIPEMAWGVYFKSFLTGRDFLPYSGRVRFVRGGQSFAALTSPSAQTVSAGDSVTFPTFTLAPSMPSGQAWGGARISGDGNPEFQLNGTGGWVQEAIVKSGDQIAVRFNAPDSGSRTVTFTLRSGQTTGTSDNASNGGSEATALQETSASFSTTAARRTGLSLQLPAGPHSGEALDLTVTGSEWHLDSARSLTTASLATALPPRVTLPHGAVSLRLTNGTPGSNATVVLTYPENLPAGTRYYKYGPTADNPADHWYAYPGAVISGNTITLTLTDGGAGDSDLSVNGIIADPGGPAWITQDVAPIPTLPQWAMMLLAGIMGMLALNRVRVRNT